jgi:Flp pilus assembly protein protease CpaA
LSFIAFLNQACLVGFASLLVAAAVSDVRERRIPNLCSLTIVLLYPAYVLTASAPVDWTRGLIVAAVVLAIGFCLSALRLFGAGDAKLMTASSLWAGVALIFPFLMITALAGGVFAALFWLLRRKTRWNRASSTAAELPLGAEAGITLDTSMLAGAEGRPASDTLRTSTSGIGSAGGEDEPVTRSERPAMELPYGAAIAVGGLAVAALLLLRG